MTEQEFQPFLELVINAIKDASKGVKKEDIVRINKTIRIPGYKTHLILGFGNDRNTSYDFTAGFEIRSIMPNNEYDTEDSIGSIAKDEFYMDMEAGGTAEEIIQEIKDWLDRDIFDRFLREKESYDYYKGKWVKTEDVTPTWVGILPLLVETNNQSELLRMAQMADKYVEITKSQKVADGTKVMIRDAGDGELYFAGDKEAAKEWLFNRYVKEQGEFKIELI